MVSSETSLGRKYGTGERINAGPRPVSLLKIYHTPYIDNTGIPLSSDRRYPELIKDIDWQYQSAPSSLRGSSSRYPNGSSHEVPISGLEHGRLRHNYREMLPIMGGLRTLYLQHERVELNQRALAEPLTVAEMREFLRGLIHLPHYLVHRGRDPIPSQGVLPPSILLLSNSAAGSLAALEAYSRTNTGSDRVPEPDVMVSEAEKTGNMVGEKTICVAAPSQMKHFLGAVINGTGELGNSTDRPISSEEIPSFFEFGDQAYKAKEFVGALWMRDDQVFSKIGKLIKNGRNPRHYQGDLDKFLREVSFALGLLQPFQDRINILLGRSADGNPLNFASFEIAGFKMPGVLERTKRR